MKTKGTIVDRYFAVARFSGRLSPRDTELYGQFSKIEDAEHEALIGGGRVVLVTCKTGWQPPSESSIKALADSKL